MNGKFYVPPPKDGSDFKETFKVLVAAGAGRPIDEDGFPMGPWTPELLSDAISKIETNRNGIDLRTVQLWFQDNDKGVSAENIRWLARVFGCDNRTATKEWQMELSAGLSRLTAKRRQKQERLRRNNAAAESASIEALNLQEKSGAPTQQANAEHRGDRSRAFNLAEKVESAFTQRSPFELPIFVFAGGVTLGFLAYILDIHSIVHNPDRGSPKQVGFIWAPNWTVLFLVFEPLYLTFLTDLLIFWKSVGRPQLVMAIDRPDDHDAKNAKSLDEGWAQKVKSFTYSYWAVFLISLPVVFLFQWSDLCLVPLVSGDPGNFVVDWGRIAILRPELISVPAAIAFTGLAYLFMGVCVFLFFVGLILLTTTAHDLWEIWKDIEFQSHDSGQREAHEVASHVMYGIFRCSVLGLLISICLKLQSAFLTSDAETIVDWLIDDLLFLSSPRDEISVELGYNIPTHFSSFLAVLAICSVFLYGSVRIHAILAHSRLTKSDDDAVERIQFKSRVDRGFMPWRKMIVVMALLVVAYLSIGMFSGFSILLCIGLALAIFGLFDPKLGLRRAT